MVADQPTGADLLAVEGQLLAALDSRSTTGLNIIGFGETGVALSWPSAAPSWVIKRVTSERDPADARIIVATLQRYIDQLSAFVEVAPTELITIVNRHDRTVIYAVQPLYDRSKLVDTVMAAVEPRSDHPIVLGIADLIVASTAAGRVAVDAQFSNFAWVDEKLEVFDVGTPFVFDANGTYDFDTKYSTRAVPGILRPAVQRKLGAIFEDMGSRRGCFQQAAMSLVRVGQTQWIDSVLEVFNPYLDEPLTRSDVTARAEKLHAQSRGIKKLMMLERAWSTTVRRRSYDVFITDSFTGKLL